MALLSDVSVPFVPRRLSATGWVWLFTAMVWLVVILQGKRWNDHEAFTSDPAVYYTYVPATFIYNDLGNLSYTDAVRLQYRPEQPKWGQVTLPNGQLSLKYSFGMAVAYTPWFGVGHLLALSSDKYPADGFSRPYQRWVSIGCMLYGLLGLGLLGLELRRYFSDRVAALTLLLIGLATNLLNYGTYEATMPHITLFLVNVLLLRSTRYWYDTGRLAAALGVGLWLGLAVLIRPSELLMAAVPLLWGLHTASAWRSRLGWWLAHWPTVLGAGLVLGLVAGSQLVYWKVLGGTWTTDFYPGETFDFKHPHIVDGLFGVRKGWLFYTPIMGVALLGLGWVRRYVPAAAPVLWLLMPVVIYVVYSWWDWGYGGSFSSRPLISLYPLLSLGMAAFWQRWLPAAPVRWFKLVPITLLLTAITTLNLLQTWQYHRTILHCCDMNWKDYKKQFFWLDWPAS
jgi:hypothetical protein